MTDCERWAAIEDKLAAGDAEALDLDFWRAHPESCELCRAERQALADLPRLAGLAGLAGSGEADEADEALVARVLSIRARERARATLRRRATAAVAVLALAAAALVWSKTRGPAPEVVAGTNPSPSAGSTDAPPVIGTTVAWPGSARLADGTPLRKGDLLAIGSELRSETSAACLRSGEDAWVCLAPASRVRVVESSAKRRAFEVLEGKAVASLAKQLPGSTFALSGGGAEALAVGTAYSLEVGEHGPVVRVLAGIVKVSKAEREERVEQHRRFDPASGLAASTHEEEEADARLLDLVEPRRSFTTVEETPPSPSSEPPHSAPSARTPDPNPKAPPTRTAAEWLREAREARRAGRPADAAKAYEALLRSYPDGAEAQAARLSLADLKLTSGDAASALRVFDDCIARGGALDHEAREGRVRALRALGRSAQERAAIADFLARYPKSMHAPRLEARARELGP